MGREVGEGFRMGNTCTPMMDSCQCMAKPIQYYKVLNLQLKKKKKVTESEVSQLCPTLYDPTDCSLPGSSVHGIFQATVLEWVAIPSPGDLPNPGMEPRSPALQVDS